MFYKRKAMVLLLLLTAFFGYTSFLYSSLPVKEYVTSKEAAEGKLLWQRYNCNACHQVYGLGGYLGPDLTNTFSLKGDAYIRAFIKNGTAIMPNFQFSENETTALIAFLQNLDASGKADPRTFKINTDGTIEQ